MPSSDALLNLRKFALLCPAFGQHLFVLFETQMQCTMRDYTQPCSLKSQCCRLPQHSNGSLPRYRGAFNRSGLGEPACSVTVPLLRAGCLAQVTHTFSKCMLKSLHAIGVWNTAYCSTQKPSCPGLSRTSLNSQPLQCE